MLFPCDLLFMIFLGGFLWLASVGPAESIGSLKHLAWLFAIGPGLYIATDLGEDILLARMLVSADPIRGTLILSGEDLHLAARVPFSLGRRSRRAINHFLAGASALGMALFNDAQRAKSASSTRRYFASRHAWKVIG